jgi:hypothetical protein
MSAKTCISNVIRGSKMARNIATGYANFSISSSDVPFHPFCDCYSAKTYHWPTVYQAGWAAEKRVGLDLRDFENAGLGVQQLTSKAR